ncbi:MAG: PKD domain-containing protein [Gemmatimonadota bacterium]|nr:PKD domain-containing protein [Gemmatimonadota bacterium]
MISIRHAGPAFTVAIISARSRETRLARAALFSVAVLFGAINCSDDNGLAPVPPMELGYVDAVAPEELKREADAPEGDLAPSASVRPSASLSASSAAAAASYTVSKIAFKPEPRTGLKQEPGGDDWSVGGDVGGLSIGFNFRFFGDSYSKFWLASNGAILFNFIEEGACCGAPIPLNDLPTLKIPRAKNNLIALAWSDLVPMPSQMSWGVRGTAPNRRLIVDFNQVGYYQCDGCAPSPQKVTTQAILYEGTNVIEVHTTSQQNPGKFVTQGVENRTATEAAFLPGRNKAVYALVNDAVRFTPVAQQNAAPVAFPGGNAGSPIDRYEGVEGTAVNFKGSATDADGDPLTYSWDFDNDGVIDASTAEASFTYADNGTHSALLKVSDGRGGVAEARVDVVIRNAEPVVDAGSDVRVNAGATVSFSGRFSDKGVNDALWSWTRDFGSLGSYSDKTPSQTAAILGSKRFCKAGRFPVTLSVVDKDEGSGSDELVVTVDALPVEIDVNPNAINLNDNGHGMITVRIFSRDGLDATALRPDAIRLTNGSGSGTQLARSGEHLHWNADADLNGDGRADVSAGFRRDELIANGDLTPSTVELSLSGEVGNCGDVLGKAPVRVPGRGRSSR